MLVAVAVEVILILAHNRGIRAALRREQAAQLVVGVPIQSGEYLYSWIEVARATAK